MYKDKNKQKQANKEAVKRRRAKLKGITIKPERHTVIPDSHTPSVIPKQGGIVIPDEALGGGEGTSTTSSIVGKPANFGQPGCQCQHCQGVKVNSSKHILNHGPAKPASELGRNELNRVALPGDPDYAGVGKDLDRLRDRGIEG